MTESTLLSRFAAVAEDGGARSVVTDDLGTVTFAVLESRTGEVAADLVSRGLSGKRIALLVTQSARWLEAFFGIARAGAIAVPLSPLHPEAEQRWFLEASRASALLVSPEFQERGS